MSRKERRAKQSTDGTLTPNAFVEVANKFIDVANRQNASVKATQVHTAFLYGSARYSAFVAKNVLDVENQETFVEEMVKQYADMLRQHLADPSV